MAETRTVNIYRAQPVGDHEAERVTICIHYPLPDVSSQHPGTHDEFAAEATKLADALWASLPGGTIDALIAEMMRRRATLMPDDSAPAVHGAVAACREFIVIAPAFNGALEIRCGNCGTCEELPGELALDELGAYLEAHDAR